jgi:hypothetical protein
MVQARRGRLAQRAPRGRVAPRPGPLPAWAPPLVLGVIRLAKATAVWKSCGADTSTARQAPLIEDVSTLTELREHLAEAEGRAVVNGLPHIDGAEVLCFPCRRGIEETDEVVWDERREGLLWNVTVSHIQCEGGTG